MTWLDDRLQELAHTGKNRAGLARALGIPPTRVTEISKGRRKIQEGEWAAAASYLEWSIDQLHAAVSGNAAKMVAFRPRDMRKGEIDLPRFYCEPVAGSIIAISTTSVGSVERPPSLQHSPNAFALWVQTREQSPAFEPRDTVLIDPARPVAIGDDCLFVTNFGQNKPFTGLLRRLAGETDKYWIVRQFNPPAEQQIAKADYPRALYIAGKYSR